MAEEITYADLRFYDSRCVSISQTLEKNTEGISSDRNNNSCRCQKKTYIIIGILIVILLLALLTMAILLLKTSEKQKYYQSRIKSISQMLAIVKNELCIKNEDEQKGSCLLCPMNWVLIQKKCYYMLDKMLSWQESQSFCESQNSSLIMPKSLEERKFITCNFQRSYAENLWIGLTCSLKLNERWLWLDNTAYIIFPSQCKEIKCASFDYDIRLATPCSTRLKTICQRLPVNLPSIN
ncbi:natural killer cells antigen CD94-like isoform X1 [Dendrobates tinctorius]|uniref:natural killer cells antigen CD94-like isoform X1 n=1 Tax=Dendrobates tinctorius TaxID=92724 RepID=UPI003CCA5E14